MGRRKRKTCEAPLWYERRQLAFDMEETIRHSAEHAGLRLRVSVVQGPTRQFYHWMFDAPDGRRVLDFWPTSCTWRNPKTGEKGAVESMLDALEVALEAMLNTSV